MEEVSMSPPILVTEPSPSSSLAPTPHHPRTSRRARNLLPGLGRGRRWPRRAAHHREPRFLEEPNKDIWTPRVNYWKHDPCWRNSNHHIRMCEFSLFRLCLPFLCPEYKNQCRRRGGASIRTRTPTELLRGVEETAEGFTRCNRTPIWTP